jgi:hypothetical protein
MRRRILVSINVVLDLSYFFGGSLREQTSAEPLPYARAPCRRPGSPSRWRRARAVPSPGTARPYDLDGVAGGEIIAPREAVRRGGARPANSSTITSPAQS